MERVLLIAILLAWCPQVFSNTCCGQSPTSFPVLMQEQVFNVVTSWAIAESHGRATGSTYYQQWDEKKRQIETRNIKLASTIEERHQVFGSVSWVEGAYADEVGSGRSQSFSDTLVGYTYEALPEHSFSYWRPLIFVTGMVNIPTGHSIFDEAELSEGSDVTGHNQWGMGLGVTLKKVVFPLSATLQFKTLRLFERSFGDLEVSSFFESSSSLMLSYSTDWSGLTVLSGLTWNHLSSRTVSSAQSESSQSTTVMLGLQKNLGWDWDLAFQFADQTLIGPFENSILNRSANLSFGYNYY